MEGTGFHAYDVVPNGIAFNAADGTFVLAGKLWPRCYVADMVKLPHSRKLWILLAVLFVMAVLMVVLFATLCNACCCAGGILAGSHPYEAI